MAGTYYFNEAQLSGTWHYARLALVVGDYNQPNNTTPYTVYMQVRERVNATSYNLINTASLWIKVNGGTVTSKTTFDWRTLTTAWKNEMSWSGTMAHNADGTPVGLTIQGYIWTNVGAGSWAPGASSVGSYFTTIPRESIPGTPVFGKINDPFTTPTTKYQAYYDCFHIYLGSTFICARYGITNGGTLAFTQDELKAIDNADPNLSVSLTFYLGTFTTSAYTTQIGSWHSVMVYPGFGGLGWIKKPSAGWSMSIPFVNVGGTWKIAKMYVKVAGVWKEAAC